MSKHEKYIKGGGINPFWMFEQEEQALEDDFIDSLMSCIDMIVPVSVVNNQQQDTLNELEAKYQFLKNHSDSPEDLQLAKEILGIHK